MNSTLMTLLASQDDWDHHWWPLWPLLWLIVIVTVVWLLKRHIAEGWVTISLQNALQFFLLSLAISALCEYTGRIFNRVGGQPSFNIMDEQSSAVELREDRRNVIQEESDDSDSAAVEAATRGS